MSDSKVVFGGENSGFEYNVLIINGLSEYSKYSKKCAGRNFLSILRNFVSY